MMKTVVLTSYADDGIPAVTNFSVQELPKPTLPQNDTNSFIIKVLYASVDPYMRNRMHPSLQSYLPHFEVGRSLSGLLVGEVLETNNDQFPVGTILSTFGEFSEYLLLNQFSPMMIKLDLEKEQASHGLGVMGMPGVTAYFGFHDILQPKKGETIVISGAGGAVGTYVGQLAKKAGCQVIGITGSDEKQTILVEELGFDKTINYKTAASSPDSQVTTQTLKEKLMSMAPRGVDMYFDNVGGWITDAVLQTMNVGGRVCVCGSMATFHEKEDVGRRQWTTILVRGLTVKGFRVIREYETRYLDGMKEMRKLFLNGEKDGIIAKQSFAHGIESIPSAFVSLFFGKEIGKLVIKF